MTGTPAAAPGQTEQAAGELTPKAAAPGQTEQAAAQAIEKAAEAGQAPPAKEQESAQPAEWQTRGFLSEKAAFESLDNLRTDHSRKSQENARLKAHVQALQDIEAGKVTPADTDAYIRSQGEAAEQAVASQLRQGEALKDAINEAVQWGKTEYPDIVTDENLETLGTLAMGAPEKLRSPHARLKYAVQELGRLQNSKLTPQALEAVKKEQQKMREGVSPLSPGKGGPEKAENYWNMKPEEFAAEVAKAQQG